MPQDLINPGEGETAQGLTLVPSVVVNAGTQPTETPSADSGAPVSTPPGLGGSTSRQIRLTSVVVVAVLIVLILVVAAYLFTGGFHLTKSSSGTQGTVLLPDGSSFSIINGQFGAVSFHINSTSTVQGRLNSSNGVLIDVMTPAQFEHLAITLNISGYEWSSGAVADQSIYNLDVTIGPGLWYLAFLDPNASFPTGVGFYSDLTVTPS